MAKDVEKLLETIDDVASIDPTAVGEGEVRVANFETHIENYRTRIMSEAHSVARSGGPDIKNMPLLMGGKEHTRISFLGHHGMIRFLDRRQLLDAYYEAPFCPGGVKPPYIYDPKMPNDWWITIDDPTFPLRPLQYIVANHEEDGQWSYLFQIRRLRP